MNLPLLLAGPILRRVDTTTASVWLALRDPSKVVMKVWEGRAKSGQAHPLAASLFHSDASPRRQTECRRRHGRDPGNRRRIVSARFGLLVRRRDHRLFEHCAHAQNPAHARGGILRRVCPPAAGIRSGLPADFRSATIRSHQSPDPVRVLPTSGSSDRRCPRACRRPHLRPRQIQGRAHPPTPAVPWRRPNICR